MVYADDKGLELGEETKKAVVSVASLLKELGVSTVPVSEQGVGHVKELMAVRTLGLIEGWVEVERCWVYEAECGAEEAERRRIEGVTNYARSHCGGASSSSMSEEEKKEKEFVYTYGSADMDVDERGGAMKNGEGDMHVEEDEEKEEVSRRRIHEAASRPPTSFLTATRFAPP